MSLQDILKSHIPEYQKGSESLDGYLEAAGEFLDETKEAIVNISNAHDYKLSTEFFYENTLIERGFDVPSRLTEENKRRILRDVAELNLKNGTTDAIIHAIKSAGLTPQIRTGWLPSPQLIRKGYIQDPVTHAVTRYDITRYVYTDMLYGDVEATADGVFFYGYRYQDSLNEEIIGPLPVLGERYVTPPTEKVSVERTPYIIVRFEEGEKTIVTEPSVDPETGETYPYSTSEEFQLINDVLRFFLVENYRPTTVRTIIIISLLPFEETLTINDDEFTQDVTYIGDDGDNLTESTTVNEDFTGVGTVDISDLVIGESGIIGSISPYASRFSCINLYADIDTDVPATEVYSWPAVSATTIQTVGSTPMKFPMRGGATIGFTAPVGNAVGVYGFTYHDDPSPVLITTVTGGATYSAAVAFTYSHVQLSYTTPIVVDHSVNLSYAAQA